MTTLACQRSGVAEANLCHVEQRRTVCTLRLARTSVLLCMRSDRFELQVEAFQMHELGCRVSRSAAPPFKRI